MYVHTYLQMSIYTIYTYILECVTQIEGLLLEQVFFVYMHTYVLR